MSEHKLDLLLSEETILKKVSELAFQLDKEYQGKELVLVLILKGALCFAADLIRELRIPFSVEIMQCKSYGEKGTERGALTLLGKEHLHLKNKDVLIIDDILDSGATLSGVYETLAKMQPKSLKTAVLLSKKIPRSASVSADYALFTIENHFVVGYGLDYKEHYRGLRGIYILNL